MLSSSARASRVCLACRLAVQRQAGGHFAAKRLPRMSIPSRRTYSSDGHRYTKEEFESLILGQPAKTKKAPSTQSSADSKAPIQPATGENEASESHQAAEDSDASKISETTASEGTDTLNADHSSSTMADSLETAPRKAQRRQPRPFRHELLHHQNLSVDALGKPVEAIIIKNPNRMRRPKKQVPIMEEEQMSGGSAANLTWQSLLRESEPSKDPAAEAMENIEEMRPHNTKVLSQREFDALSSDLVEGFTQGQLADYIAAKYAAPPPEFDAAQEYSWASNFVPWEPTEVEAPANISPKSKLANSILQKVWHISVREHVEGLGRAEVWIQPNTYHLLAITSRHVLEGLRTDLLDPTNNEKIIAQSNEARLTIHSRKSTVSLILARLDEFAQSIVSQEIPTDDIHRGNLNQAVLDELGRITQTALTYTPSKKIVTASWIASADRPAPPSADQVSPNTLEAPADTVRRLLMVDQENNASDDAVHVITSAPKPKTNSGQFMEHHRENRSMSWRDKLLPWFRYVAAVEKPTDAKAKPLKLAGRVSLTSLSSASTSSYDHLSPSTYATFGHILHSDKPVLGKGRRILSPVVPHPAALTDVAAQDQPVQQEAAIILNFSPASSSQLDAKLSAPPPQVRLRLPIDPDTDLSSFSFPPNSTLHGIIRAPTTDLLFPKESVDARVTQQLLLALDVNQPSLQEFLAASEFNLLEGRLRTPSHTTFTLPSHSLSMESSTGTQDIPYIFTGLEIHQTVEAGWHNHTLRYTSIEAGQHGGQRQELSLHPTSSSSSFDEKAFLQVIGDVATGELVSWNDGHTLMQTTDEDADYVGGEYSADLMEGAGVTYREEDLVDELPSAVPKETAAPENVTVEETGVKDDGREKPQAQSGGAQGSDGENVDSTTKA